MLPTIFLFYTKVTESNYMLTTYSYYLTKFYVFVNIVTDNVTLYKLYVYHKLLIVYQLYIYLLA